MTVQIGPDGDRSVAVDAQVAATPGDVWAAIATSAGLSCWFVSTDFELGDDGVPTRTVSHFGPGMDAVATVTDWDPPRSFRAVADDFAPGGPPVTTDWRVTPLADDSCRVSVRHSLPSDSDEWDPIMEAVEAGWPAFFRILQIYCAHFSGQPCTLLELQGASDDLDAGWTTFARPLGVASPKLGEPCSSPADAPRLAGVVEDVPNNSELIIRLDAPSPGVAHLFALPIGDRLLLTVRLYLYGDASSLTAAAIESDWRSWMRAATNPVD